MLRPDGDVRIVRSRAEVTWDESGRPRRMFGVMQHITDLRQAERALRRNQTFLAEAQRMSRTGSFAWNPWRAEITWSDETHRIFGLDHATPPTIAFVMERTHPDDRPAVEAAIRRAEAEGTGFDLEHRLLMPDGSVKHLRVVARAVTDEEGRREFAGAIMDITEGKRAEEERRAHVWFLESMDRVNRAVQGTDDLERMMGTSSTRPSRSSSAIGRSSRRTPARRSRGRSASRTERVPLPHPPRLRRRRVHAP